MTNKEIAERISEERQICKKAEQSINEMKIALAKYKGEKTKQTERLANLENVINLSIKQGVDMQTYEDLLAQYLIKIGELSSKLKEMHTRYALSERIHEVGVESVVDDYVKKCLDLKI